MKIKSQRALICAVAFSLLVLLACILLSPAYQVCIYQQAHHEAPGQYPESATSFLPVFWWGGPASAGWCIGAFIDANDGAITAFATLLIAVFTIVLAYASIDQSKQTREAFTLTQGANVFLKTYNQTAVIDLATKIVQEWQFVIVWENSGSTPTKDLYTHSSWASGAPDIPANFNFPDYFSPGVPARNDKAFMGPKSEIHSSVLAIPAHEIAAVWHGAQQIYLYGWVEYNDVFPGTPNRRTEFCNRLEVHGDPFDPGPQNIRFFIHSIHNGADGQCYRKARAPKDRDKPL